MKLETVTAPAHWAAYLINGDMSGIEDEKEEKAILAFEKEAGHCVDVGDSFFANWHEAFHLFPWACDVAEYTFDVSDVETD